MKWFGESWGAEICTPALRAETPVGEPCARCGKAIEAKAQGFIMPTLRATGETRAEPHHLECVLATLGPCGRPECSSCNPSESRPREIGLQQVRQIQNRAAAAAGEAYAETLRRELGPLLERGDSVNLDGGIHIHEMAMLTHAAGPAYLVKTAWMVTSDPDVVAAAVARVRHAGQA